MSRRRRRVVGFYTDEEKRVRPITAPRKPRLLRHPVTSQLGRKPRYKTVTLLNYMRKPKIQSKDDLKREVEKLVDYYMRKTGVTIPIKILFDARKRRHANVYIKHDRKTGEIIYAHLKLNHKHLLEMFKRDPELARRFLNYAIAHEIAHLEQRQKFGLKYFITMPSFLVEEWADKRALELTGMTKPQLESLISKLTKLLAPKPEEIKPIKPRAKGVFVFKTYKGKPVARIIGWWYEKGRYKGKYVLYRGNIYDWDKEQKVPKSADKLDIVLFDPSGNPIIRKEPFIITRDQLKNYYIIP